MVTGWFCWRVFTATQGWISGLSSRDIFCSYMRIWTSPNGLWDEIEMVWASVCVVLLRFRWWVGVYVNDPRRGISALKSSWDDALISLSWKVKNRHSLLVSISLWWHLSSSGLIRKNSKHKSLIICFIMNDNPYRSTLFSLLRNYKCICSLYLTLKSDFTQAH